MSSTSSVPQTIPPTAANPKKSSGISSGIRIIISFLVAIALGLLSLFWYFQIYPDIKANYVLDIGIIPGLAIVISFLCSALVQWLSCGQIQWLTQASRLWIPLIPFLLISFLLFMFPSLRWPIEGLYQEYSPTFRFGLSSGFYTFWMALYTQAYMNGLAQSCPK